MHNVPVGFEPFQKPGQIFAQFMLRKCWRFAGFYRSKERIVTESNLAHLLPKTAVLEGQSDQRDVQFNR